MENSSPLPGFGHSLPAKQRGPGECGDPLSNSCHQWNDQLPVCQTDEEEKVRYSLKTHSKSPSHSILRPVQPCGWVWFLQRAAGLSQVEKRSASGGGSRASQTLRRTHRQERKHAQNRAWLPATTAADQTVAAP